MKSILNKLTIEKFDSLYEKLIACGISKPEHIELLVSEVFDKACTQHLFIEMYADLCVRLEKWLDSNAEFAGNHNFRRILLNQCQDHFEQSLAPPAEPAGDLCEEERMELAGRHKQRVLGNMKLVGMLL